MNQTSLVGRPLSALVSSLVGFAEKRGIWSGPLTSSSPELARLWAGLTNSAGVLVNDITALGVSTFFAATSTISDDVATIPLLMYQRLPGGGKQRYQDHPLYPLLHDEPNPEQSTSQFRAALMMNVLCTGNAFAEIVRDGAGRPRQLWHLDPSRVRIVRDHAGRLAYDITQTTGGTARIEAGNMIHLTGPSPDGVSGFDMVTIAREALALAIASERFGGTFFANGATFGGLLTPGKLTEPAQANLRAAIAAQHQGVDRSHRLFLVPDGSTFTPTGVNPRDSQMAELRNQQVLEICRFLKFPPAFAMSLERATWGNFGEMRLQYYTQNIRVWLEKIEQELTRKLLRAGNERATLVIEHNSTAFLRADDEKRAAYYKTLSDIGVISINEIRELENLPPVLGGDVHRVPMNFEPLPAPVSNPITPARMAIVGSAHRDLIRDTIARWSVKIADRASRKTEPAKLREFAAAELKERLFAANFIDMTRGAVRAWLATADRASEADDICAQLATYFVDSYFQTLLVIGQHHDGDDFNVELTRQLARWRDAERVGSVIDHLILHGAPPPVETRAAPRPVLASHGGDVRMMKMVHRQRLAESDLQLAKREPMRQTA